MTIKTFANLGPRAALRLSRFYALDPTLNFRGPDSAASPSTKPYPAKGRQTLEPATFDCELDQIDTFSKMSFHAFSDLTTLKKRASTRVIHRKGICRHVVVEDKLSAELRHKHVAHWITRILNATLEFSNPLRRELRIIVNVLFGSDSTRNSCR